MTRNQKQRTRRSIYLGAAAVLLGAGAWLYGRHAADLAFLWHLLKAYRLGRSFYASYDHLARNVVFDPELAPRLDVYSPPEGGGHPVLVFVHGGSWKDYHKELFAPLAMELVPAGIVVVIPDYTLYPDATYEQMAHETAAAVSWTLENIERYGGDPGQVILAGHSAGGHLAGLVATDPRFLAAYGHSSDELCGLIGMSGVYDVQTEYDFWAAKGPRPMLIEKVMGGPDRFAVASPIDHVRADLPPILLIHGEQDRTVPASIAVAFEAALQAAGARSELKIYPGAGHTDYLFAAISAEQSRVVDDVTGFVRNCVP
jgi:acetyl esterase/lipase